MPRIFFTSIRTIRREPVKLFRLSTTAQSTCFLKIEPFCSTPHHIDSSTHGFGRGRRERLTKHSQHARSEKKLMKKKAESVSIMMLAPKNRISIQRWISFIIGGLAVLFFALLRDAYPWMAVLAGAGFFLGLTDFGRRCPLLLSVPHHLARIRKKE